MTLYYDVFNGDADGICALHQLRLAEPRPMAALVTGVKRDIRLLHRIRDVKDADITVLDISMESNLQDLRLLLANNCRVFYVDHHFAGTVLNSPALTSHIDPDPEVCTALLVDRLLAGRYRTWAVVGAFGDNLHHAATRAASSLKLADHQLDCLRELGELLNYNGYGLTLADLHFPPQRLYEAIKPYPDPFEFYQRSEDLARLRAGYQEGRETSVFLPQVGSRMVNLLPRLKNLRVRRMWRGLYPMTSDGTPLVGWNQEVHGLLHATGMCGQGFMLGPGVGEVVARLITEKVTDQDKIILEGFSPYRKFGGQEALK